MYGGVSPGEVMNSTIQCFGLCRCEVILIKAKTYAAIHVCVCVGG